MTASAVGEVTHAMPVEYATAALTLALMSGLILLAMGVLRLGFLANFLSHPVISGFISASGLLIAASQLKTLLGISASGDAPVELIVSLGSHIGETHALTLWVGLLATVFLFWVRTSLKPLLRRIGLGPMAADLLSKAGPVLSIIVTSVLSWSYDWEAQGMKIVGTIPQGLPPLSTPAIDLALWHALAIPALLISVVGFVESISVAQTLAAKRRQRIEPNQELIALGASNVSAALTSGFPVTGGFARSVVNFDAGARTPAAGVFTAVGILLASLTLTPVLYYLPQATLSATIVVAVLSLVDFAALRHAWSYSRSDFAGLVCTLLATLMIGVEIGLVIGVLVSLMLFLYRTSKPHIAEVGLVPGTEHFRNVKRHKVQTHPELLCLRVDENLYFANARALEDRVNEEMASHPDAKHLLLQCNSVSDIDWSALESLEAIERRLADGQVKLSLSEVKGPVMDKLQHSGLIRSLDGRIFLTNYQAFMALLGPKARELT
jgi:SulP family sulfate permease